MTLHANESFPEAVVAATGDGTMIASNPTIDASRAAIVGRAQMELIDMLARLVLTSVEQDVVSGEPAKKRNEHRGHKNPQPRSGIARSTPGNPPTAC